MAITSSIQESHRLNNRVHMLEAMDLLIRAISDERAEEEWLLDGVPDGSDWDDLAEIANDEESFQQCWDLFYAIGYRYYQHGYYDLF